MKDLKVVDVEHFAPTDLTVAAQISRLKAAGVNPLDPKVQTICDIVNAFYAEKTREVLEKMQAVLSKIPT